MAKILLIDDDRSLQTIVDAALSNDRDYQIVAAETGVQGIEVFCQLKPDVLLLDLYLPESHGFDLYRQILAIDARVPVIFITADGSSEVVIQAMRLGAFDYLKKPLKVDRLRQMVASAVAARKAADRPVALNVGSGESSETFIGSSTPMVEVFNRLDELPTIGCLYLFAVRAGLAKSLLPER